MKRETVEVLEESMGSFFFITLEWKKVFLTTTQNSEAIKERIENFCYIKIKNILSRQKQNKNKKLSISSQKTNVKLGKSIYNLYQIKGLIFIIYKELLEIEMK